MTTSQFDAPALAAVMALLAGLAAPAAAQRGGGVALQHDVFARPNLSASAPDRAAPVEVDTWRPTLRAIVLAGERSLVLVDKSAVELGGAVNGYRLVGVTESRAVFVRGGQRMELTLGRGQGAAR